MEVLARTPSQAQQVNPARLWLFKYIIPIEIVTEIANQATAPVAWWPEGEATMHVLSPLAGGRMSVDEPFNSNLQELAAAVLAAR